MTKKEDMKEYEYRCYDRQGDGGDFEITARNKLNAKNIYLDFYPSLDIKGKDVVCKRIRGD